MVVRPQFKNYCLLFFPTDQLSDYFILFFIDYPLVEHPLVDHPLFEHPLVDHPLFEHPLVEHPPPAS